MNEIEDKIKSYLYMHLAFPKSTPLEQAAHDIVEIVQKELLPKNVIKIIKQLEKENAKLKQRIEITQTQLDKALSTISELTIKLSFIKYLNRAEVEKIIYQKAEMMLHNNKRFNFDGRINVMPSEWVKEATTAIRNLAIQPIDKYRIIKAIKKYSTKCNNPIFKKDGELAGFMNKSYELDDEDIEQIANEILNNKTEL